MNTFVGCSIVIYDDNNSVLISKRSKLKKHFLLMWKVIGGALEDKETPEECIRRKIISEGF